MNNFYCGQKEWDKIIAYSRAAYESMKTEIGGMALMIKDDNDDWHLKFPVILKQTVTAGNTHLDKEALAEYYGQTAYKMLKKKATYRYLWWHSHHTMGAFWSGTDQDTINEAEEMSDLSFSLVVNLKEEYKFRVALWKPVQVQQDVTLQIEQKEKKVSKAIQDEVEELCSEEVRTIANSYGYSGQTTMWRGATTVKDIAKNIKKADEVDLVDKALEEVQVMIDGACDGTLKYDAFTKKLDKISDALIEAGETVIVRRITKEQFNGGQMMGITPYDLIMDEDTMAWNRGYYV